MDHRLLLLAAPEFLTLLASILFGVYAWKRRRIAPGLSAFPLVSTGVALWSLGGALAVSLPDPEQRLFWLRFSTLGIDLLPLAWLAFVYLYSRKSIRLPWPIWVVVGAVPALSQALLWSSRLAGSLPAGESGPAQIISVAANYRLWDWLHIFYALAVVLLGAALLLNQLRQAAPTARRRTLGLAVVILAPMPVYIAELSGFKTFLFGDLTPLAFVLAQAIILISTLNQQNRQILPMARDALINCLEDGLLVLDPDNRIVEMNPAVVEVSDLPSSQVLGRQFTSVFPEMTALIDQAHSLTAAQAYITRGAGKNRRYYQVQVSPLLVGKGSPFAARSARAAQAHETRQYAGSLVLLKDITGRRQAEQALKESEERYQTLFQNTQEGILIQNEFGGILSCNPAAETILGLGIEQMAGRAFSDPRFRSLRADGSPLSSDEHPSTRALASGEPQTGFILGIVRPNGVLRWLSVNSHPLRKDDSSHAYLLINSFTDITQARNAEQAARSSEQRFKTILQNIPLGLALFDAADGLILATNTRFEALLARRAADLTGQPLETLFSGPTAEACRQARQELTGRPGQLLPALELAAALPGGEEIQVEANLASIPDDENQLAVIFLSDLGEVRRQGAGRRQAEAALESARLALDMRARELQLLSEMTELLENAASAKEACAVAAEYSARLFPQCSGALYLTNGKLNLFETQVFWGSDPPFELYFSPDMCWGLKRGRPHMGAAADNGLNCKHVPAESLGRLAEYICIPMVSHNDVIGLYHLRWQPPVARQDVEYLAINTARQITLALANLLLLEELRRQSIRDPLTGLFNRHYMEETLERELRRAARYNRPVGVILLGIDFYAEYKRANGNAAAEALVRAVGNYLLSSLRGEDIPSRFSEERFLLILPDTALEGSSRLAEKIRQGISSLQMDLGGIPVERISVSLGVVAYPRSGLAVDELLAAANEAWQAGRQEQISIPAPAVVV